MAPDFAPFREGRDGAAFFHSYSSPCENIKVAVRMMSGAAGKLRLTAADERTMPIGIACRDQFEISPKGITHKPTGATYTPHPGAPHSGTSQLGNMLPNGEDYRPHEVTAMMELLWAGYVDTNPRLFEVHD